MPIKNNRYIQVILLIVIILIAVIYTSHKEASPTVETEATTQEQEQEQKQVKSVNIKDIEVPENVANIKVLSEELDNIGIDTVNSGSLETIASSVGLLGEIDETLNINRYQLADILYNIIYECNKLPDIYGYQISYSDAKEIPTKYIQPVCYVTYLELYKPEDKYNGYNWITEDELKEAMSKLKVYMDNYVAKEAVSNEDNKKAKEREALKIEAEEILKSRSTEDRLNGQSVAIFKNPKTLNELEANIKNITPIEIDVESYATEGSEVKHDYLNLDEALLDVSLIANMKDVVDMVGDNPKIMGITYLQDYKFSITSRYNQTVVEGDILTEINRATRYGIAFAVGIKDNSVKLTGIAPISEQGICRVYFEEDAQYINSMDYIGLVVDKPSYDNTLILSKDYKGPVNSDYVIVAIQNK